MLEQELGIKKIEKYLAKIDKIYEGYDTEIDDITYLKKQYRTRVKKDLDLQNPIDYNEKLQWLKLYWRDEKAYLCANKYTAREYVSSCGYSDLLHPILKKWESEDEIVFDDLPESFIIKATHASGMNLIVNNKNTIDIENVRKIFGKILKMKYYLLKREWVYAGGQPSIICERLFEHSEGQPLDYKFFCFNGEIKAIEALTVTEMDGLKDEPKSYFCDDNLKPLPVRYGYELNSGQLVKPKCFDLMKEAALELSKPFPHVRVDFCVEKEKPWFGEFTFFPGAGYDVFEPEEFSVKMGTWLELPKVSKGEYYDRKSK